MTLSDIEELFQQKYSDCFDTLSEISYDISNKVILCNFKNKFINFDKVAKKYHHSWPSTDMIFFDLHGEYIVFVEYKNAKKMTKKKLERSFLKVLRFCMKF
ncbi:hypothetical protein [Thioflexithrix psekupsensis]|uniref:Uncharacterized protein n=1 Tax=Thioflexithrix psekupsensis TaxID=1570016 RepID=A0A251X3G3_9GAMM|nr:hypothetical protein [Thioflexithrix psekupsensis]OUD11677.1 hypothetical protein TPSD3_16615 [Thioflexithrix psekupsensis]